MGRLSVLPRLRTALAEVTVARRGLPNDASVFSLSAALLADKIIGSNA